MPTSFDEELQERIEQEQQEGDEEDQHQEALQALEQEQRQQQIEQIRVAQQQKSKQQSVADTAKTVQKWTKRYEKSVAVGELLVATFPIWGTLLLVLLIVGGFIGGCNSSTTFRISTLGACEPFMLSSTSKSVGSIPASSTPPIGAGTYTDAAARQILANAGITVNALQPQTSLEGIKVATVLEMITFKQACTGCTVVVTGGTETNAGHEGGPCSHLSGNKFDIRANPEVNNFIQNTSNFSQIANRSDGALQYRKSPSSVIYARELDHWDIGGVGC